MKDVDTSAEDAEYLARCLENNDWFSAAEMIRDLLRARDEARLEAEKWRAANEQLRDILDRSSSLMLLAQGRASAVEPAAEAPKPQD